MNTLDTEAAELEANRRTHEALRHLGPEHVNNIKRIAVHFQPDTLLIDVSEKEVALEVETMKSPLRNALNYYLDLVAEVNFPYRLKFSDKEDEGGDVVFINGKD